MTPATVTGLLLIALSFFLLTFLAAGVAVWACVRAVGSARKSAVALCAAKDLADDCRQCRDEVLAFPQV